MSPVFLWQFLPHWTCAVVTVVNRLPFLRFSFVFRSRVRNSITVLQVLLNVPPPNISYRPSVLRKSSAWISPFFHIPLANQMAFSPKPIIRERSRYSYCCGSKLSFNHRYTGVSHLIYVVHAIWKSTRSRLRSRTPDDGTKHVYSRYLAHVHVTPRPECPNHIRIVGFDHKVHKNSSVIC